MDSKILLNKKIMSLKKKIDHIIYLNKNDVLYKVYTIII